MEDRLPIKRGSTLQLTAHAATDLQLVELWAYGRATHTRRAYLSDFRRFFAFANRPLATVTLLDLQDFARSLKVLSRATQARLLSSVKSLLAFAHRTGYLPFDVGRALRLPPQRDRLAERILPESEVHRLLALEPNPRNRILLTVLYAAGVRVSELCGLFWRDAQPSGGGGQLTVWGKGGKTRAILLPESVWRQIASLREDAGPDAPIFRSRKGGRALDPAQISRILRAAARRAGIEAPVSPHWLRHAHASHALDRGAPIHLVQSTLGHASIATTGRYLHARPNDSSSRFCLSSRVKCRGCNYFGSFGRFQMFGTKEGL